MKRALLTAVSALAVLVVAGGCGEAKKVGPVEPRVRACNLLTEDDAAAALGESANYMTSVLSEAQGSDPAICGYNAGSDTTRTINLEVRQAADAEAARRRFDSARSLLSGAQDQPGIGEAAFWVGREVDQLHVLAQDLHLIITSHPGPDQDALGVARKVGETALSRIPR